MALSQDRIIAVGQTTHPHEREAYEFAVRELPDTDPYRLWAFIDLIDPSGRRYDLDLLVVAYHAIYLVEIKSYPGTVTGDGVDWQVTYPGGGRELKENPLRTTNLKAKVLATLLTKQFDRDPALRNLRRPWVQPLVFLAHQDVEPKLTPAGAMHVVTRQTFREALAFGKFPGAPENLRDHRIDRPIGVATHRSLLALGLKPSVAALKVEGLLLRDLLAEGTYYQDHLGEHQSLPNLHRRVRSYVIPASTTAERREQVHRAARREAQYLTALSDHRNVLRLVGYVADGPLGGPCVIFEHLEKAVPLDVYLRAHPDLGFDERITLISQVAEALEFCHRKGITHRGLAPSSILVRETAPPGSADRTLEVRIFNFQLAAAEDTSGTVHVRSLAPHQDEVYIAPEVLEKPATASPASDVFSLGAVAYHVLTGRPPGSTLAERAVLLAQGHLSVAAARDDLAGAPADPAIKSLDDVIAFATAVNPLERADSAIAWLNLLLDASTAPTPEPDEVFVDALVARRGDRIAPDIEVVDVLGSGSTARVLRVRRDGSDYALKIALSPELDDRVRREGQILAALHGDRSDREAPRDGRDRIATLHEVLTLGERVCLLMTDAGDSLAALLAREGPPSLDFARRWGEDLLRALEALEDKAIQHRDIKPANLGVLSGQAKKRRSLLLFDFSLSGVPETAITAGTPVYRDPFLDRRGRWDPAADRWAAAIALHEMLTGSRPRWGARDMATATSEEIEIAAERFDAQIRARLHAFFRRALARDVAERFRNAEDMRVEWTACFATTSWKDVSAAAEQADGGAESAPVEKPDLAQFAIDTPIGALPLSARAKNAIDRAGMTTLGELLQMSRNRLSTTRGIGRTTHEEILEFVDDARAALGARADAEASERFVPAYRGAAAGVAFVPGLSAEAARALEDAGLGHLDEVAGAPRVQVERVLASHGDAAQLLRAFLEHSETAQARGGAPAMLEDWLDQLLARSAKRSARAKYFTTAAQLLGLDDVPGKLPGVRCETGTELARALGHTRAAVHIALAKAREKWREHVHLGDLVARVRRTLDGMGGVGSVARVAAAVTTELPHRPGATPTGAPNRDLEAEAVVRIAAECTDDLVQGRLDGALWVARGQAEIALARELGRAADELAGRVPLPSSEEVCDVLGKIVKDTVLATLPVDRLVSLAAEASRTAARSTRLELYPRRDLSAARAIALSAGALSPWLVTPDTVQRIVRARYPEAIPPPDRPELDDLLKPLGLEWDPARNAYTRPAAIATTALPTRSGPRMPTTHTSHRPPPAQNQDAVEFEARLRLALEKGHFRVLDVTSGYDEPAAEELARRTGARRVSLEREVLAESEQLMAEWGVEREVVLDADRAGPSQRDDWDNLRRLMKTAAERTIARVIGDGRPVILTQPGILARYQLDDVVGRLVEHAQNDDAAPVLLVNPIDVSSSPATIDAATRPLPVPLTSQAQRLRIPESWICNLHRGGA